MIRTNERPAWRTRDGEPIASKGQLEALRVYLAGTPSDRIAALMLAVLDEVERYRDRPHHGQWWGAGLPADVHAKLMANYKHLPPDVESGPPLDIAEALLNDARVLLLTGGIEMDPCPAAVDRAYACVCDALRRIGEAKTAADQPIEMPVEPFATFTDARL